MGIVYSAVRTGTNAQVALKTVRSTSGQHLTALRREIRALGQLRHPGVVEIVDHGVADGLPWYAMRLLVGSTLADRLSLVAPSSDSRLGGWSSSRMPPALEPTQPDASAITRARLGIEQAAPDLPELLAVIRSVCTTLAYVHGSGFVHRDLKPSNIFIDQQGAAVLVDFGIVSHFASSRTKESVNATGHVAGSVPYMSPEQVRGELADARSDLYSLGCILYECLTGRPPFSRGSSLEVMNGHLWADVIPPSELVPSVPSELDELTLQLLRKNPKERIGYADVVASTLAPFCADARPDSVAAPSYLYRASFVRRDGQHDVLERHLKDLVRGRGGMVLLGGESGVGKTRSATELASAAQRQRVVVTAGECAPAGMDPEHDEALMPFRSVLQAMADFCYEAGPNFVEGVVGNRGLLLAQLEPTFRGLPLGPRQLAAQSPRAESAAKRLLDAVCDTLLAFAQQQPMLVVLDDLHWADDLSLALLDALRERVREVPLLILGTFRGPELSGAFQRLLDAEHVEHVEVTRLTREQVAVMAAEMLGVAQMPPSLLEHVYERSEGVAFYVSEYLMAEIARGVLSRNSRGEWSLGSDWSRDSTRPLPPGRVREQFLGRVHGLSPVPHALVTLAAVFGREVRSEWLRLAAGLGDDDFNDAVQQLRQQLVFDDAGDAMLRFHHEQLRLFVYESTSPQELMARHAQVAAVLERSSQEEAGERASSQLLAYHLSRAEQRVSAARHFARAGDECRGTWRNHDAIKYYSAALYELQQLTQDESTRSQRAQLFEMRGDAEALAAHFVDAARSHRAALAELLPSSTLSRARLHRKLGKGATISKEHATVSAEYDACEGLLQATAPTERAADWWLEWIELQVERAWWLYWRADLDRLVDLIDACRADVAAHGTLVQRARLLQCLLTATMRRENYCLSDKAATLAREARTVAEAAGDASVTGEAQFLLGFALLFHERWDLAAPELRQAVQHAELHGDVPVRVRALTYLSVAERREGNRQECERLSQSAIELARQADMTDYLGAAEGNLAWAALRRADVEAAIQHGQRAVEAWARPPAVYPFQWLARWPLAAALERANDSRAALQCLLPLLDTRQHVVDATSNQALRDLTGADQPSPSLRDVLRGGAEHRAL